MTTTALPTHAPASALAAAEEALLRTTGIAVERADTVVNGTRLHYLTCGEGEPLLLLHGRGNAAGLFAPVLAALAAQRRIIALDLPGWGLSDKPRFTGATALDALDLWRGAARDLLDVLGVAQADVLGHSMGGFTAAGLALAHPERVRRLLLVDPGGIGGVNGRFSVRLYFRLKPERINPLIGRRLTERIIASGTPGGAMPSPEYADFMYRVMAQRAVIPSGGRAFDHWIGLGGSRLSLTDQLHRLTAPVLLLWGEHDFVTPYANAAEALSKLPDGRLVTFANTGHSPIQERPDALARVVNDWLDGRAVPDRV